MLAFDFRFGTQDQPVTEVTWEDAVSFCLWLTRRERARELLPPGAIYRLPSLAEWKAAAWVHPSGSAEFSNFSWGKSGPPPGDYANVDETAGLLGSGRAGRLLPVKSLRANDLGFFDLVGNAAEWCLDVPLAADNERIYCGGSWSGGSHEELQGGGVRKALVSSVRADVGFRLALDFKQPGKASFQLPLKAASGP